MPDFAKSQVLRPHISDETDQIRMVARVKETTADLERNQLIMDIQKTLVEDFNFDDEVVKNCFSSKHRSCSESAKYQALSKE